ncbi:MAG: DUF2723 domain-containing protein [Anaerolineae bacterium]|nr:DUF2723 domain-containing protein [Anaerolineae bacterium]
MAWHRLRLSLGAKLARLWPVLAVGWVAGTVYVLTVAPSLTWAHWGTDGGDFVTAAATGRLPHPPGFPIYYLLSRAIVSVVPGDPAKLLNALSAAMATGAACWTAAAAQRRGASSWVVLATGLGLAFAPWVWSQAVIAEVYTCVAFFTALVLYLASSGSMDSPRDSWITGLALGMAASVHPTALGLLVVVGSLRQVAWPWLALGLGLGLTPYVLLPLAGPWPQPWGDLNSLGGWWHYVSGRLYWGNAFGLPLDRWPQRVLAWAGHLARQFTPLGAMATLLGLRRLWQVERRLAVGIVLAVSLLSVYAIGYNSADSWVYLVAYLPALAIAMGHGLQRLAAFRVPQYVSLVIPFVLLLVNWSAMDVHADYEAVDWLADTLEGLPQQAVVLTEQDAHTFTLWYGVDALGLRQDATVVDTRLWGFEPYVGFIRRRVGEPVTTPAMLASEGALCEIDEDGLIRCR